MEKTFFDFGTTNYIRIDDGLPADFQAELLVSIQQTCDQLDDLFSAFKSGSDMSRIRQCAGSAPVIVHPLTLVLLEKALYYAEESNGAFDPTIRPAVELWHIGKNEGQIPSKEACKEVRALVDYHCLHLDLQEGTAFLEKEGQALDLGGIAKGYAADCAKETLLSHGVQSALLNFGGTILTIGKKKDGTDWICGIQNPVLPRGQYAGYLALNDGALVTSGVNERFFIKDRKRYHHLLSPYTCEVADAGVLSVSAAGGCAADLDALTTALFVLGAKKGLPLAQKLGFDALYIQEDGQMLGTSGFAAGNYKFRTKR